MADLIKRGKRYYIRFRKMIEGEPRERTLSLGTNWKDVAQELKKKLEKLEDQREIDPYHPDFSIDNALSTNEPDIPYSVDVAAELWLNTKKKKSPRTYITYKARIENFINYTNCGKKRLGYITETIVESFLFRDGVKPVSANSDAKHLSVWFNYMVGKGWIASNPVKGIKLDEAEINYHEKILTPKEYKKLITAFDELYADKENSRPEWFKPMTALYFFGGFRLHEIAYKSDLSYSGLKFKSIINDFEVIWIPPGKGKKERLVPVSKFLKPALKEYVQKRGERDPEEYIFINENHSWKERPVSGYHYREIFRTCCRKAGISDNRIPHGMRHGRITQWLEDGFSMKQASMMGGHSSTKVTESIYSHLNASGLIKKLKEIEKRKNQ
ncbi:MAG: tyrosine-type recombinase/integrase [Balneolaceae bacterium]